MTKFTLPENYDPDAEETPTPRHDAIVEWVDRNGSRIATAWIRKKRLTNSGKTATKTIWEYPVVRKARGNYGNDYVVGYIDIVIYYAVCEHDIGSCPGHHKIAKDRLLFEIKPQIVSCGALIRQMRKYQQVEPWGRYIVVSPDTRWRDRIKAQGYGFIDPHRETKLWTPMVR